VRVHSQTMGLEQYIVVLKLFST